MPKRVLIVEDDPSARRLLEEAVAALGYTVMAVESAGALEGALLGTRPLALQDISFESLAGASPAMVRAIERGRRAAESSMPVLIEGEPGVGKGAMARALHGKSARRGKPFIAVHCAALQASELETILFGTGEAGDGRVAGGKLHEADGGTLFLDAVGELSPRAQTKLLAALDQEEIHPHGVKQSQGPGVRLIAATEHDLIQLVQDGRFREDLYYRLIVIPIRIPPLRDRLGEIAGLALHFIRRFAAEIGKRIDGMDHDALALLTRYDWPGNIRQLENAVFRAVVLAEGPVISGSEFPQIATRVDGSRVAVPPVPALNSQQPTLDGPIMLGADLTVPATIRLRTGNGRNAIGIPALGEEGDIRPLGAVEADLIRLAFGRYRGRMSEIAKRLGIGRSTLYRKLREIGLEAKAH